MEAVRVAVRKTFLLIILACVCLYGWYCFEGGRVFARGVSAQTNNRDLTSRVAHALVVGNYPFTPFASVSSWIAKLEEPGSRTGALLERLALRVERDNVADRSANWLKSNGVDPFTALMVLLLTVCFLEALDLPRLRPAVQKPNGVVGLVLCTLLVGTAVAVSAIFGHSIDPSHLAHLQLALAAVSAIVGLAAVLGVIFPGRVRAKDVSSSSKGPVSAPETLAVAVEAKSKIVGTTLTESTNNTTQETAWLQSGSDSVIEEESKDHAPAARDGVAEEADWLLAGGYSANEESGKDTPAPEGQQVLAEEADWLLAGGYSANEESGKCTPQPEPGVVQAQEARQTPVEGVSTGERPVAPDLIPESTVTVSQIEENVSGQDEEDAYPTDEAEEGFDDVAEGLKRTGVVCFFVLAVGVAWTVLDSDFALNSRRIQSTGIVNSEPNRPIRKSLAEPLREPTNLELTGPTVIDTSVTRLASLLVAGNSRMNLSPVQTSHKVVPRSGASRAILPLRLGHGLGTGHLYSLDVTETETGSYYPRALSGRDSRAYFGTFCIVLDASNRPLTAELFPLGHVGWGTSISPASNFPDHAAVDLDRDGKDEVLIKTTSVGQGVFSTLEIYSLGGQYGLKRLKSITVAEEGVGTRPDGLIVSKVEVVDGRLIVDGKKVEI